MLKLGKKNLAFALTLMLSLGAVMNADAADRKPLNIAQQGFFAAGGVVVQNEGTFDPVHGQMAPAGQTHHADHASAIYQVPVKANGHSMVFLHGYGQSRLGWMGTPDGREGWSDIFLRKGYSVYMVDQPRRGDAGQTTVAEAISTAPNDQNWYTQFRIGKWPVTNPGSQFPDDEESLNQFFRQMTPNTGSFDANVISDAMAAVFERSGKGILVSHSQGGGPGWLTAAKSDNVEAVVAIEPGTFPFPENDKPENIPTKYAPARAMGESEADFAKIIAKPITVYFGDYIPEVEDEMPSKDYWRGVMQMAYKFQDYANAHGGDVTIVNLPKEGITGNDHFIFQDKNNDVVAEHIYSWLKDHKLK